MHVIRDASPVARGYERVEQDQALDPLWKVRSEELSHRRSFGYSYEVRPLPTYCVHNGQDVLVSLLKCRCVVKSVR